MGKVYIFSGAGLSAESGVPTFRDADGLWNNHKIEDVCDITTWRKNFNLVHKFYNERRKDLATVQPNAMHELIAKWQHTFGVDNVVNVTTNVDNLLERAGVENVIHLHGVLTKMVDTRDGTVSDIGYTQYDYKSDQYKTMKPYVVFFGEHAPEYETLSAITNFDLGNDDMVIFIGMSFVVVPVYQCLPFCKQPLTININPNSKQEYDHEWSLFVNKTACESVDQVDRVVQSFFKRQ